MNLKELSDLTLDLHCSAQKLITLDYTGTLEMTDDEFSHFVEVIRKLNDVIKGLQKVHLHQTGTLAKLGG